MKLSSYLSSEIQERESINLEDYKIDLLKFNVNTDHFIKSLVTDLDNNHFLSEDLKYLLEKSLLICNLFRKVVLESPHIISIYDKTWKPALFNKTLEDTGWYKISEVQDYFNKNWTVGTLFYEWTWLEKVKKFISTLANWTGYKNVIFVLKSKEKQFKFILWSSFGYNWWSIRMWTDLSQYVWKIKWKWDLNTFFTNLWNNLDTKYSTPSSDMVLMDFENELKLLLEHIDILKLKEENIARLALSEEFYTWLSNSVKERLDLVKSTTQTKVFSIIEETIFLTEDIKKELSNLELWWVAAKLWNNIFWNIHHKEKWFFYEIGSILNFIIKNSPHPFILFDENWKLLIWNTSAEKLTGYTHIELMDKSYNQILSMLYKVTYRKQLEENKIDSQSKEFRNIPLSFTDKIGNTKTALWTMQDFYSGKILTCMDVTYIFEELKKYS